MRVRRTRGRRSRGPVSTYVRLMLVCTAVAVAPAVMIAGSETRYESSAQAGVRPAVTRNGSFVPPDLPTEQEIARSRHVTRRAAARIGVDPHVAAENIEITVADYPHVLDFTYTADDPQAAHRGARAFSEAYVAYRNDGRRQPTTRLVAPAELPDGPVTRDYARIVGVAVLGGLGVGFGVASARDRLSGRLRSAEDAAARTGLPVLASLPHLSRQRVRSSLAADAEPATAFCQLASRVPGLVASRKEFTLLVIGATAHAGTSTIARQTALALARMGKRVVLVCADPTSSGLQESFGLRSTPGLSDLLAGTATPAQALHETAVPGLRVLPPGANGPSRSSQSLDDLQLLIWTLAADAVVVIDAPAVLSSPSAALLGYVADRVLLVVDLAHGSRSSAHEAAGCLMHVSEKVAGCVTNKPARVRGARPSSSPAKSSPEAVVPAR